MRQNNSKKLYRGRRQPSIYSRTETDSVKKDFKKGFLTLLLITTIIGLVYFLFFSPLLKVANIEVGDLTYSDKERIITLSENFRGSSFINKNIITFRVDALKNKIMDSGGIKSVAIKKKYPNTITIRIEERSPSLVWQVIDRKYLVDENGLVWADYDDRFASIPVVLDTKNVPIEIGKKIVSKEFSGFIQELNKDFSAYTDTNMTRMEVADTTEEVKVISDSTWYAYFNTSLSPNNQLINLSRILGESKVKKKKLEYIDLRIDNRIFYK